MRSTSILLASLTALLIPILPAVSTRAAAAEFTPAEWKEVQGEFASYFASPGLEEDKVALLKRLLEDGTGKSLKLIGDALVKECDLLDQVRSEWREVIAEHLDLLSNLVDGYTPEEERAAAGMPERVKRADEALAREQRVLHATLEIVSSAPPILRDTLFKRARTAKDWGQRAAAARLAVLRIDEPESVTFLRRLMQTEPDGRVRSAALEAIGDRPEGWESWTLDRLADADWSIQLQAIHIVKERAFKPAVPHLINALSKTTPRVAQAIADTLKELTGEEFGPFYESWAPWWEKNRAEFESGVEVRRSGVVEKFEATHFYGLPIHSDRVIFVIDISNSMKLRTENGNADEKWKAPPPAPPVTGPGAPPPPPPPPPPEALLSGPKIEVMKHELRRAIQGLPEAHTFTIVAFNSGAAAWKEQLVPATEKNKQDAYTWIRGLKPYSVTYIEGALRRAFQIAGVIDVDKAYVTQRADTIVLMSDGAPTDNHPRAAKNADPEALLALVREWNKRRRIVIHAVGVDMIDHIDFLKKLAEQNGGTYIDR